MRSYKRILPILLVFALVGSVIYSFQQKAETNASYQTALEDARHLSSLGAYVDASKQYGAALEIKRSLELEKEIGDMLLEAGDIRGALNWYEDTMLSDYSREPETYEYGMQVFAEKGFFDDFFDCYETYQKRRLNSESVEALFEQYKYQYQLLGLFDDVGVFTAISGMAPVKYNDHWGAVNKDGKTVIYYNYNELGPITDLCAAITKEGRAVYLDRGGNEKLNERFILEKDPEFGAVKKFQTVYDEILPAHNGSIWNYYNATTLEKLHGGYQDAIPIANGIGAISPDGSRWAVINAGGALLTDAIYDEILVDGKGVCCRYDRLLARAGVNYYLVDTAGHHVNESVYTAARPFNDTTMAAVQKDGKWIFVDLDGAEYDLGRFDDAQSFSGGLAAVKKDGLWGYIDSTGAMVIDNIFADARAISAEGVGFVQQQSGEWNLISLIYLNH